MKYFLPATLMALGLASCAHAQTNLPATVVPSAGRALFLKNCAHCHGADARGDEGPDLHTLDLSDAQINQRIRNGKKGQMTAFEGKLKADEIKTVTEYVKMLK